MPPRLSLPQLQSRSLAIRPRVAAARPIAAAHPRSYANDSAKLHPNPDVKAQTDPNAPSQSQQQVENGRMKQEDLDPRVDAAPHVTEEAAAMAKVMGEQPPEVSQGTPVNEVFLLWYF